MGDLVDIRSLVTFVNSAVRGDISGRIVAADILRTVEGASTLTVTINDYDRKVLRSGLLVEKLDVQIDGLWFRLTTVDKSDDSLTLTFEDREIAVLRTYKKWRIVQRSQMTRAEFILSMIREVKEFDIPIVIPELAKVQPVERYQGDLAGVDVITQKSKGVPPDYNNQTPQDAHRHGEQATTAGKAAGDSQRLTVKGATATQDQIRNANIIMAVADAGGLGRKLKIIALMTAITETRILNDPGTAAAHNTTNDAAGDDSAGVFQQRPGWGSYTDRTNVETSTRLFFNGVPSKGIPGAVAIEAQYRDNPYWDICAKVQHPALQYETRYALWRTEAERFVSAQGDVGTSTNAANNTTPQVDINAPFYFYRGSIQDRGGQKIRKAENTWDCAQRLSDEVDWRSFFVAGTFYYLSEADLFQQLPLATITEFQKGIDSIDGSYDNAKKTASIEITARVGRWQVPPGSVVVLKDMGPYDGRWLVNDFTRDLLGSNPVATITLKKPRPKLPEPLPGGQTDINASWVPGAGSTVNFPPTSNLGNIVLQNNRITFSNRLETTDISLGYIDDRVLRFLLWFVNQGYSAHISALKSDHPLRTTKGAISAHSDGRAVDIDTYNSGNPQTEQVMKLIGANISSLGLDQLIGPIPSLCIRLPFGFYDQQTLNEHKSHIHIGFPGPHRSGNG